MLKIFALSLSLLCACANLGFSTHNVLTEQEPVKYRETTVATYNASPEAGITATQTNQVINYVSRSVSTKTLALRFPTYTYSSAAGACACVAGGNALGFYDRYDENLIPNHTSGTAIGTTFSYSYEDEAVMAVIDQLYVYMGTDSTGTTETGFIEGITKYCKEKNKTVTFTSCMSSGSFSYTLAKKYLEANQPIILFLSGYNVASISESSNKDTINYLESTANHVMVGFGYKEYTYTLSTGTQTLSFLSVASGIIERSSGLFNTNYKTKINDALAINIG